MGVYALNLAYAREPYAREPKFCVRRNMRRERRMKRWLTAK